MDDLDWELVEYTYGLIKAIGNTIFNFYKEEKSMELTIFAKRKEANGTKYALYSTSLKRKDGTEDRVSVKFREECGKPDYKKCPCNIIVEKKNMNLAHGPRRNKDGDFITAENGEVIDFTTLWISEWKEGSKYVDHSLDDYDI